MIDVLVQSRRIGRAARWLPLAAAMSMLLAACGGAPNRSWPGLAFREKTAFLAYNNFVSAVNVDTGAVVWKYPEQADAALLFYSNPVIDEAGHVLAGAYNGTVVALDPASGKLVWQFTGGKGEIVGPVLDGPGGIYVSSETGSLFVLDPTDGTVVREIALDGASWGPMATDGERVFLGTLQHFLIAVEAETGAVAWQTDLGASIAGGVTVSDGMVLTGTLANTLVSVDAETGRVIWRVDAGDWVWGPPAVRDGVAYSADMGGKLRAVDLKDGSILWTVDLKTGDTPGKSQVQPLVSGDVVLVATDDGYVRAFSLADGAKRWEQKQDGGVLGGMVVAGGRLLVTTQGGKYLLSALSLTNGANAWSLEEPK